ncbi:hypothetical protein [Prosthecobacter sp.]|uniref:hypothetical protein n=1 Tax=Prosthecobacter sp. TaxID=1965333 RepID=UPI003783A9ED
MKPLLHAIEVIRAVLKEESPPSSVEDAAITYAQACADAERRLDRVSAMLQKGSDYQALQVAEEEPPLLDLAAILSFGEEKNWYAYCESHGLKTAVRLNARIIQDLENLYAKGISANHPLYKDFRSAVLSRDDEKSLRIVRTILKLNPQDDNARKELQRLENKGLQEKIDLLRDALKTDDEERIASLTEGIKAVAPPAKLERLDVFHQGEDIRQALRRRQAQARVPGMLATMHTLKAEGQWHQVGKLLETLDALIAEHGLVPADDEQQSAMTDLTRYFQKEKAADEKQRSFDRALKSFIVFVEEVETRLLTGSGVTFAEVAEKDETFVKRWKELEAYSLPVANDALQRLRTAGQELRARLERMQRARRIRTMSMAAAALVLLCCISAVCLHAWKAWSLTQELASYQKKESTTAAQDLIKKLRTEEDLLLRWPYLQAKIEEVSAWASKAKSTDQQAQEALLALEKAFDGDSTKLPPSQLVRQLADAETLVKQLAGDLASKQKNRLTALKTKADLHLATVLKDLSARTATTLGQIEKTSTEELSHEKLVASVRTSRDALDQQLQPLEALLKPEVPALALPADLETRIKAQRQRLNAYKDDIQSFATLRTETSAAKTLEEYRKAVAKWQAVKFAEAAPATKMLDTMPSEKAFQAALYTSGDQDMLQAILDDKSGRQMYPDTLLEADLKGILSLLHDERLNNIFESTLLHYSSNKPSSTIWSTSKPEETVIGGSTRWSTKFYMPDPAVNTVMFVQQSFTRAGTAGSYQGDAVQSTRLSQTSQFMNFMDFGRITDEKGERVQRPLLEAFDKLLRDTNGSPVAKAYVMLKLYDIVKLRPYAWGDHLCPSLQQDIRELRRILASTSLRSEDWLIPSMREKWNAPLASFFKSCKDHSYMTEASARRTYLRAVANAGLKFAGYVETDLSLVLNTQGRSSAELWVVGKDGGKPLLVTNPHAGAAASGSTTPIIASASLPLSPVFVVSADRKALAKQYQDALSSPGVESKPVLNESVFLTVP